jgi:Protein of unknown function (DUF1580)
MLNDPREEWIPIRAGVNEVPLQLDGKTVHPSTLTRWALYGLHGVKLASHKIAGRRYIRRADLARFLDACSGR